MPSENKDFMVEVIWKIDPDSEPNATRDDLLRAHWRTAKLASKLEMSPGSLLIRSGLHNSTIVPGQTMLPRPQTQADEWHVTTSWKDNADDRGFWTAHGYTYGPKNFVVHDVTVRGRKPAEPDAKLRGKRIWPEQPLKDRHHSKEYISEKQLNLLINQW